MAYYSSIENVMPLLRTIPKAFRTADAAAIVAAELSKHDGEWAYKAEIKSDENGSSYRVAIYDEDGKFVDYWGE